MQEDCIFCKIAKHSIPSTTVYEDEHVIAFKDLEPQAPVHVLIIPKKHLQNLLAFSEEDQKLISHIFLQAIPKIAESTGVLKNGFRLVANTGKDGGQTVEHLHFHLLGGRFMEWPPG